MATPPSGGMDTGRLAHLLDQFQAFEAAGAAARSHKDYYDREGVLDEMQQMLGLGMVRVGDIVAKAKATLGRK